MNISNASPKVSSYNFMRYLCATLAKSKNVIIDITKIVDKIYSFKQKKGSEYRVLFEDIEFRATIDNIVSNDINEGLNNLQTFGIVGKLNPTYEKIVIYLTEQEADEILQSCDGFVRGAMDELANTFSR
jgi:uncharacterized membrane protein